MNEKLYRRSLLLSYITVGYNVVEGILSILLGFFAGSSALIGFGSDSFVESISGSVLIWRFRKHGKISPEEEEKVEKKAVKLVGISFFLLGVYVVFESVRKLYLHEEPDPSIWGLVIAGVSMITMPLLFYVKYRTGKSLKSASMMADSKQTLACFFLSVALFAGLGANYILGWWRGDPIAGIVISLFLFKEGYETLKENELG